RDLVLGVAIELCKSLAALCSQRELILPPVGGERLAGDQAAVFKVLHDAAEVARIEAQLAADLLGGQVVPVRELIDHPCLAQRVGAFVNVLVEHADLAGIGAVEGPHRGDLAVGNICSQFDLGHGSPRYLPSSNNYLTLASIFSRLGPAGERVEPQSERVLPK